MSRIALVTLVAALLAVTAAAVSAEAKVFQFRTTNEYVVEKDFNLSVFNTSGSIEVSYRPGDKVVVETITEIDASSREEAEKIEDRLEVEIRAERKLIEIDARYPDDRRSRGFWEKLFGLRDELKTSIRFVIEVPTSLELEINSTSGDIALHSLTGFGTVSVTSGNIKIVGHKGELNIETTSGDISLKDAKGDIEIKSISSDILLDNITGDISVQSTSGDTEAHWTVGKMRITKTSGAVRVDALSGDIDVRTTSGNIDIDQKEGGVAVESASGDVRVRSEMVKGKHFEIKTISGDISMTVPADMQGRVKLETISGSINTDLAVEVRSFNKHRLEGKVGGEGPDVILSTTSGDIDLNSF